ncbi:MAG: DMT family transporter [Opitutae bacterium]|nr:DMT family transporter [Opitutae bacterium]
MRANVMLLLTACIWGFAFIPQRTAMDHMGPYFFNALRFLLGAISLLPICWVLRKKKVQSKGGAKQFWIFGGVIGCVLFCGAALQQVGLQFTTAGKAGFITGLYLVLVPIIGFFLRQRIGILTVLGAILATVGLYYLSVKEGFAIGKGDALMLIGAFFWAVHVQVVGYASRKVDPLRLALVQYFICSALNFVVAFRVEDVALHSIVDAYDSILYCGIISVGIAYTLQIVAQQHVEPSRAAIIMSLEAVFALYGGWLMLDETLSNRELTGCILMFAGMLFSQIPVKKRKDTVASPSSGGISSS